VRAVFVMAPALVQAIDPQSLARLRAPVRIVAGDADTVAPPATNAQVAVGLIPDSQLDIVPKAGHYAFLSTCTPIAIISVRACTLAGAQEPAHRVALEKALELFGRALGSP
jgi:predicted dienelactone hydrolase